MAGGGRAAGGGAHVRTVIVDRHLGVDTIALVATVGALAPGEGSPAQIGVMFTGGAALEAAAVAPVP